MTVQSQTSRVSYAGAGTTGPFAVPFYFLEDAHLQVIRRSAAGVETTLTLNTDYTVTGAGLANGGEVNTVANVALGETLAILRNVPMTQLVDYVRNDPFPETTHELALDKLTMIVQQLKERLDRALTIPATDDSSDLDDLIEGVLTLLGIVNDITTVAGISTDVTTVAGIAADVTAVAAINAAISTLALIETQITTLAALDTEIAALGARTAEIDALYAQLSTIAEKVNKSGDTMTGPLTLSGPPAEDLHAVTKLYVDMKYSAPSMDADDWSPDYTVLFRALTTRSISRVIAKQVFRLANGVWAMLATSRYFDGTQSTWGTSLFFSEDKINWRESRANPIFNQIEETWQGERAMGEALVWDHQQNKWALFFSGDGEAAIQAPPYNSQGIRAIGLARSDHLVNGTWTVNTDPVMLVEDADILTWHGPDATRVYCAGAPHWDAASGYWYMPISVGQSTDGNPFTGGIVKATTLDGPWTSTPGVNPILEGDGGAFEGNQIVPNSWVRTPDGWVMAFRAGNNNVGLATATQPEGPWTKSAQIIELPWTGDRTVLIPGEDGWMLISSEDNSGTGQVAVWSEKSAASVQQSDPIGGVVGIRPYGYRPDYYYFSQMGAIGSGTAVLIANRFYAIPIVVTQPVRMIALGVVVTAGAAGNVAIGLYANRDGGQPGELVFQTAAASTASAATIEQACDEIVAPGLYWLCAHFSAAPTVRAATEGTGMDQMIIGSFDADPTALTNRTALSVDATYSATLPNTFAGSVSGRSIANCPRLFFKAGRWPV